MRMLRRYGAADGADGCEDGAARYRAADGADGAGVQMVLRDTVLRTVRTVLVQMLLRDTVLRTTVLV